MAEQADARDLKSLGDSPCGFKSRPRHQHARPVADSAPSDAMDLNPGRSQAVLPWRAPRPQRGLPLLDSLEAVAGIDASNCDAKHGVTRFGGQLKGQDSVRKNPATDDLLAFEPWRPRVLTLRFCMGRGSPDSAICLLPSFALPQSVRWTEAREQIRDKCTGVATFNARSKASSSDEPQPPSQVWVNAWSSPYGDRVSRLKTMDLSIRGNSRNAQGKAGNGASAVMSA